MRKGRVTITGEIDLDPEGYAEGVTPELILDQKVKACRADPGWYVVDNLSGIKVTGELLPEDEKPQAQEEGPEEPGSGA